MKPHTSRLLKILAVLAVGLQLAGCWVIDKFGGDFNDDPNAVLSKDAQLLRDKAFDGFRSGELVDFHTHFAGLGNGGCDAYVNPKMLNWWGRVDWLKGLVYMSASRVTDRSKANEQYGERLVKLIKAIPEEQRGRYHILGFDWHYDKGGRRVPEDSTFYMSNDCMEKFSKQSPDMFRPVVSVNPYRPEAVEKLKYWADKGVKFVKWLPPAQGIDASDPYIDEYYKTMIRLTVTTEKRSRDIAGTLFADERPRIVAIRGIELEAELGRHMLYITNRDKPGLIGSLGTLLGAAGVNIATFHLGRAEPGGDALALIEIDEAVSDEVLEQVAALPLVVQAKALSF